MSLIYGLFAKQVTEVRVNLEDFKLALSDYERVFFVFFFSFLKVEGLLVLIQARDSSPMTMDVQEAQRWAPEGSVTPNLPADVEREDINFWRKRP